MTIDNKDGAAFLAYVTDKLETRIAHISQSILEGQKDIEGMHEYYWENYTEMDQYGYENFDNQQALLHQINANEQQIHLRKRFRKMLDSPFFGRVDFVFEGDEEPEIFYIGIGNFAEKNGMQPLIKVRRLTRHRWEPSAAKLPPSGSTRFEMAVCFTSLKVM